MYKMKDMTLCIVCVILGIMLSTIFKTACGCRNIVEGNQLFKINSLKDYKDPDLRRAKWGSYDHRRERGE